MTIKQFESKALAHYSYAIVSEGKMAIVDPTRNPFQYYQYAEEMNAKIVAVFESHPHADFVSGHLQIQNETGADIYVSEKLGADYPHKTFDDDDSFKMGKVQFSARNTPGHSPDSICILATDKDDRVIFTGDTLFINNVGRPDLREKAGNMQAKREDLAGMMYDTMKNQFSDLSDDVLVYPAHGAGSLCGKGMSTAASSTIGQERLSNWAFQEQSKADFVSELLQNQPMIPHYFGFDVDTNKKGANNFAKSIGEIPLKIRVSEIEKNTTVVDVRDAESYKKNHLPGSFNITAIREKQKFETWLGSIVKPEEEFYLVVESVEDVTGILERTANIGYENQLKAVVTLANNQSAEEKLDVEKFKENLENYTIIDVRNAPEVEEKRAFENAINLPLHELRESMDKIPTDKPIVVHCAAGYRSAAGSSIVKNTIDAIPVYDLGASIDGFW